MALPAAEESRWLRRFHPRPQADISLVCLPHAGGTASFYFPLSELLPPTVEALAVQYPGRQDRLLEPCLENVQEMAHAIFEVLKPSAAKRPLALFGHSMGASVGFELAGLLEQRLGIVPAALFPSSRSAPSRHRDRGVHLLDDAGLIAEIGSVSGTDSRVLEDPELLELAMPSIRSDYQAAETYQYRPGTKLRCDVVALTGDHDPWVDVEDVAPWREHTTGSFDLRVFTGDHFYLGDQAAAVCATVTDALHAATSRDGQVIG